MAIRRVDSKTNENIKLKTGMYNSIDVTVGINNQFERKLIAVLPDKYDHRYICEGQYNGEIEKWSKCVIKPDSKNRVIESVSEIKNNIIKNSILYVEYISSNNILMNVYETEQFRSINLNDKKLLPVNDYNDYFQNAINNNRLYKLDSYGDINGLKDFIENFPTV